MGENFQALFGDSPWGPMALAFLFGVAFGWVVWGARRDDRDDADDERDAIVSASPGEEPKEIVVIKAEIQAVKNLLDQNDEGDAAITEQLSKLDEAMKRANGRLKLIISAIKRAGGG